LDIRGFRQSVLAESRLERDGCENENACYQSHPNWDEVGPPLTTPHLSIMKVNSGRDELTGEVGWQLANALVVLRQDVPRYKRHQMFAFGTDTEELRVRSGYCSP
jgi:hypothetical protein